MAESDAEWFVPVDRTPKPKPRPRPSPPPTESPRRRPGTGTPRRRIPYSPTPWVPPYMPPNFTPRRPKKPTIRPPHRRNQPRDEADTVATSNLSSGAVAAISVISSLVVVAVIIVLLYFIVFRKKLTKKAKTLKNDYSTRVEDIIHVTFDDSSNTYVNTQDIQKLVETIRKKPKEPIPCANDAFQSTPFLGSRAATAPPIIDNKLHKESSTNGQNPQQSVSSPVRPAPPPPKAKPITKGTDDISFGVPLSTELFVKIPKQNTCTDTKELKQKPLPPILPKPKLIAKATAQQSTTKASSVSKPPVLPIKPVLLSVDLKNKIPIKPRPKENSKDVIIDKEFFPSKIFDITSELNTQAKPELLSLSQKRAMWEDTAAKV